MINFDSLSLKALRREIEPILTAGRIQRVQQPSKHEILLTIRTLGKTEKLYICVDPQYPHIAMLSKEGEKLRNLEIPPKPPMFCMLLRKHMEGCKINEVIQPDCERILEIYFDSYSELGAKVPLVLSCELMGKHSNIVLYNYETNVILGCAHPVSHEKSRERELAGGLPYVYPPKQNKIDLNKVSENHFLELVKTVPMPLNLWLNEKFGFISRALSSELCKACNIESEKDKITAVSKDKIINLYALTRKSINLENLHPSISTDKKSYSPIGIDKTIEWNHLESINLMIDLYFGHQVFKDKFSRLKTKLVNILNKELKKQTAQLVQHEKTLKSKDKQEKHRQNADILMANLYKIKIGLSSVELENIYNNNELVTIKIDPLLSANENAQKYYKLYNKAKTAAKYSEELFKKILDEVNYIKSIHESINQAETIEDLNQVRQELIDEGLIKTIKTPKGLKPKKEKITLSEFISSDGFKILVGKNNKQNDYLLKNAEPEDTWLHVLDIPGSHVLIKVSEENNLIPETTLHEAVYITAYYSQARESSNVPVVYTKRKFVKKPSGSKPGFVIYSHEKTLWVNPEEEMVLSLKKI